MKRPPATALVHAARLSCLAGALPVAWAQAEPPKEEPVQVQRVEITAQKRVEVLQEVPAAVTAITSKQIEAVGIVTTQDFVDRIPNMSFDSSFTYLNSFVQLRGVAQINNADSPVAIVIDGVPQNNQKQFKMNLVDIQRIEVLKGPQGALYGRNAIGGAVNIVTKQPTDDFEGFAGLSYASGNDLTVNAGVSGALVPEVARFRLIGQARRSGGQITNTYLNEKVDGIDHDDMLRGKLALTPHRDVAVDVQFGVNRFRGGAVRDAMLLGYTAADVIAPDESMLGKSWGSVADASVKLDWDSGSGTLTSISAYTNLKENYRGDIDFSNPVRLPSGFFGMGVQAGQGQNLAARMLSQELRWVSPDNQPVRYIVGVYGLKTKRTLDTRFFLDEDGDIHQWDDAGPGSPTRFGGAAESNDNLASAVFGQLDYDVGANWTLSAALRHDSDRREQTDTIGGGARSQTFSSTQPKLTLTWKPNQDHLMYATYATGFRSGGWNGPGLPGFKPETLKNFEVGSKHTLLGGAMTLNLALFQADSKDFQYFFVDLTQGGAQIISNIEGVRMRGFDLDARWRVTRDFEVDAGIGYTNSLITQSSYTRPASGSDPAVTSVVGNHTPKNTPLKINLGAQYTWALAGGSMLARLDVENRSKKYWQIDNRDIQPGVTLLSARLSWAAPGDAWSVALWGKNLTNEKYYADVNPAAFTGLPYAIGWQAAPRTLGVDAKVRF